MLTYVEVGAAGPLDPRWKRQIEKKLTVDYVGFEPDDRSHEPGNLNFIPVALGHRAELRKLNLTKKPQVSSLLSPNKSTLERYLDVSRFEVVGTKKMRVQALDDVGLNGKYFLINLDTQGKELEILRGAVQILKKTLAIVVEVEFQEIQSATTLLRH